MPCRRCMIAEYLVEEASLLSKYDKEEVLCRAANWHEECEGKDCDCDCPKPRGVLRFVWPFRIHRPLPEMVRAMLRTMDCPNCHEGDLAPYGSKWRCERCSYIEPCCTTDCPADGRL